MENNLFPKEYYRKQGIPVRFIPLYDQTYSAYQNAACSEEECMSYSRKAIKNEKQKEFIEQRNLWEERERKKKEAWDNAIKIIIAGSRKLSIPLQQIDEDVRKICGAEIPILIFGDAYGVDQCAQSYALREGIQHKLCRANWDQYGKRAGPIRNAIMAQMGNILLLYWDGKSRGSKSMKHEATIRNLEIVERIISHPD